VTTTAENRALVERFWQALYDRDWDRIAGFFGPESEYTDVPSPADDTAVGPEQIVARLRLGIEPVSEYSHETTLMVADGEAVVTEHAETWHWKTGEQVTLPFVSVHVVRDGVIVRWWDYWDLQTLLGAAPAWWIEHIMVGWKE
jgi:limonene-1,2-epoxide hydrolase